MKPIVSGQRMDRANTCPSSATQLMVSPPSRAADTLSAWMSSAVAALSRSRSSCAPARRSNSRRPATVAAALLPSPPFIGMSVRTSMASDGNSSRSASAIARNARSM
jgi:hypothetical protein